MTQALLIGDTAPNFTAITTEGEIDFHKAIDGKWAVLFSHPKNYTPGLHHRAWLHLQTEAGIRQARCRGFWPVGRQD